MSLFGDLDIQSAEDDPFAIPDNTYECDLTEVKAGPTKAGDKVGMTLEFTISEGDHAGKKIQEWKRIPDPTELTSDDTKVKADAERAMSFLKARMLDLGIPVERVNSVTPEDLLGIHCFVSVKNNNGYTNVRKVTLAPTSGVSFG